MPPTMGITFAPTTENAAEAARNRQLSGAPLQDAIKILALRLPRVLGVRSLGPLTAERPQAPAGPESAVLQTLLGGGRPASVPGGAAASSGPPSGPASAAPQNEGQTLLEQIRSEVRGELPPPASFLPSPPPVFIPGIDPPQKSPYTPPDRPPALDDEPNRAAFAREAPSERPAPRATRRFGNY